MGNALYDKGRNRLLKGEIAWKPGGDSFRAYLIDLQGGGGYSPNLANDEYLSAISSAARVAYTDLVVGDPVAGVADASDLLYQALSGPSCEAIVIVKWVTNESDSPMIAYIDTAQGLPATLNGSDVRILWDGGANKIFKL